MLRPAVLAFALILAAAQNATLLCSAWCVAQDPPASACEHVGGTGSLLVVSKRSCTTAAVAMNALPPADTTRACLTSGAADALIVGRVHAPASGVLRGMLRLASAPRQPASSLLALRI